MAISGILRPGFVQIRVLDMPAAVEYYTKRVGLHQVCEGPDGRVYLKAADEFDHHSIVLRRAEHAGVDLMSFKCLDDADLDQYEKRIVEYGIAVDHVPAGEQPGVGRRIGFTIPSGHRIELYAHADQSDPKPYSHNPHVWSVEPHGMAARRFDHALLYGPNIDQVTDFFVKVLDFRLAERVDMPDGLLAVWLTCGMKAHDIAFVKYPEPGKLHHISFELENWQAVGNAADIITHYDISIDIGPTRHGITRGQTIYFFDPSGNRNEVFAGGYTYYPDSPTRTWDETEVGKGIFYYERKMNDAFLSVVT
ncbi:catechol 2,3-dioxygenase [Rhodoblastus acidophilus]|uniref:Metapyrocatechase n=1 Tax=Candidatus Rhodoblastus alkanivorans TaxID=2954117 RepID=A0ABS9Z4K2_9HYPH|nr:catechol 2,3-dioxygenase [Candidatus Rhodoblastus alkanivorans]MCI4680381.1 catechol 2,3-dioxygenase [Candidatus Rhodoblastus alkanivorans]MCI4682401.1 catechol 2,3-dioxygenase [Candidatus Rhodoblastus alkanivorans]MDI4639706.1 catechol 2,3-dioxygenase [Rhodoblastus acidophilus]